MTAPQRPRQHLLFAATFGIAMALATASGLAAPPTPAPAASTHSAREAATRVRLASVKAEIARIAAAHAATSARRDALDAKLATQAKQLDAAANAVHATDAAIADKTAALAALETQRTALQSQLTGQRAALAALLRAAYTLNRGSDLTLLLGNDDIAKIDRALAYSRYFQHDRLVRIHTLLAAVAQLSRMSASIATATAVLQQQRDQRSRQEAELERARAAQAALLAEANRQLAQQQDRLAALKRDAAALDALLKQLQNIFSDIPAGIGQNTPFLQLRGKLPWPVTGKPSPGTGALAHGLVIAATPGAAVHAVAYGRVAWANYMRGYGILVIIDQGDGWMTLYGGNESTSVSAGEWVKPGQTIATVARNSEQGGAWFGIRHDGQPVDPHGWLTTHQ